MVRKYKRLRKETISYIDANGVKNTAILQRIKAIWGIPAHGVKAGEIGGYVSSRKDLSHDGNSWIGGDAIVINSLIVQNGLVTGNAVVIDSVVGGSSIVAGNAKIEASVLNENSKVKDEAVIHRTVLSGNTIVKDQATVKSSILKRNIIIHGKATVINAEIGWLASIGGMSRLENVKINIDEKIPGAMVPSVKISGAAILENVKIMNDAVFSDNAVAQHTDFHEHANIKGQSKIINSVITGDIYMSGNCYASKIESSGTLHLADNVSIKNGAIFIGSNSMHGEMNVLRDEYVNLSNGGEMSLAQEKYYAEQNDALADNTFTSQIAIKASSKVYSSPTVYSMPTKEASSTVPAGMGPASSKPALTAPIIPQPYIDLIKEIEASYEAYTADITKLILYPAMVDMTIAEICDFVMALRTIKRKIALNDANAVTENIDNLERLFVIAENKARTLSTSLLDESKKKRLKKANDALSIALDKEANEHERIAGYKSGLSNLDGVIDVSTDAVRALKAKIGLKELLMQVMV